MIRVEIFINFGLESELLDAFKEANVAAHYSRVGNVLGCGCSEPKMGDSIWPQVNSQLIIYCSEEEAKKIKAIVEEVRENYPSDGVSIFFSSALEL